MARNTHYKKMPEYGVWAGMRRRCHCPRDRDFARWGARGIKVCDAWRYSFLTFVSDMGPRPSAAHSIDRIDNDGDYEPSNCRWALSIEQSSNRRGNVHLTHNGETKTAAQWARELGIGKTTISFRLAQGWTVEEALTRTPSPLTRGGVCKRPNDWSGGEKNAKAKLSGQDVAQIRASGMPARELATKFSVSVDTIRNIRSGKTWRHIQIGAAHVNEGAGAHE